MFGNWCQHVELSYVLPSPCVSSPGHFRQARPGLGGRGPLPCSRSPPRRVSVLAMLRGAPPPVTGDVLRVIAVAFWESDLLFYLASPWGQVWVVRVVNAYRAEGARWEANQPHDDSP